MYNILNPTKGQGYYLLVIKVLYSLYWHEMILMNVFINHEIYHNYISLLSNQLWNKFQYFITHYNKISSQPNLPNLHTLISEKIRRLIYYVIANLNDGNDSWVIN